MPDDALSCPYCSASLPVGEAEVKAGVPVDCQGCGKVIDLDPMVASYELMLKHPRVFLKGEDKTVG
jgi:uncharacterized Zn-finger protein